MLEEELFSLLDSIQGTGLWLSIVAWLAVAAGVAFFFGSQRGRSRDGIRKAVRLVLAGALAANLLDYSVTLYRSPGLEIEANPLWRNVVDRWGLEAALWYGLSGKVLVSIFAAQMFGFYLANRRRLYPSRPVRFREFLFRMGEGSSNLRDRFVAIFTMFAFFFAGIQFFGFYVALWNWIENPYLLERFPSVPLAVLSLLAILLALFLYYTYRAFSVEMTRPAAKS